MAGELLVYIAMPLTIFICLVVRWTKFMQMPMAMALAMPIPIPIPNPISN